MNLFRRHGIEPDGLDKLQPLIHQGGRVNGYFCAHGPVGMFQRLLFCDKGKLFTVFPVKRPAGSSDDEAPDLTPVFTPLQALKDCGVLRVHRDNFRALLLRPCHHQLPSAHQGLLVGQCDALAAINGGQSGAQPCHTHDGSDHRICFRQRCRLQQPLLAGQHFCVGVRQPHLQLGGGGFIHRHHQPRSKFPDLGLGQLHAAVHRDGGYPVATGLRHLQRLPPDGTAGTQNRQRSFHRPSPQNTGRRCTMNSTTGPQNIMLSNRSSIPP